MKQHKFRIICNQCGNEDCEINPRDMLNNVWDDGYVIQCNVCHQTENDYERDEECTS